MILVVKYSGFFKRFFRMVQTWCVVPRLNGPGYAREGEGAREGRGRGV